MSKEAMKLALEALEYIEHNYMSLPAPAEKAITALREALAEKPAQQKPVAWMQNTTAGLYVIDHCDEWHCIPLYTSPQPCPTCEALKLALEALEFNCVMSEDGEDLTPRKIKKAITAIREALAEHPAPLAEPHEQQSAERGEPAAWVDERVIAWLADRLGKPSAHITTKLSSAKSFERPMPLYTSPPAQRKPLDAGEISRLWKQHTNEDGPHHNPYDDDGLGFARAIEAAHGIKENRND